MRRTPTHHPRRTEETSRAPRTTARPYGTCQHRTGLFQPRRLSASRDSRRGQRLDLVAAALARPEHVLKRIVVAPHVAGDDARHTFAHPRVLRFGEEESGQKPALIERMHERREDA